MVAIAMRARLALPGDGIELLGHPLAFPHLLALLRFLTGAIGGWTLLRFAGELHLGRLAPIALDRTAQAGRNIVQPARDPLPHVSQPFRPALDILAQAGPLDAARVVLTYRRPPPEEPRVGTECVSTFRTR